MNKFIISFTLIYIVFYPIFSNVHSQEKRTHPVSAKRTPDGYTLSINSDNLPLEAVLNELINQCQLKIITYEEAMFSQPITISFKDMPLEQGIKRLLKASGINNYFIQYRNDQNGRSRMAALTLLGKSTQAGGGAITDDFIRRDNEKDGINPLTEPLSPEDKFTEKAAGLKERYEWADEGTEALAGYLLEIMPEAARDPGMEALMKALDRRIVIEGNDIVDETIFFQALEDTAPSHLAPAMMESIKHYSQQYKTGATNETFEQSPDDLYQEIISKRHSKRNITLKRGRDDGYEKY